jgi:hypothetical protein
MKKYCRDYLFVVSKSIADVSVLSGVPPVIPLGTEVVSAFEAS